MKRLLVFICAMLLVFGLGLTTANAIPVVNGSFEDDNWSGGFQYDLEISGLTGWLAVDPGNASPLYPWGINESAYGNTPYGEQFVVVGGYGADLGTSIQQTVSGLTVGEEYILNFALSSEGYSAGGMTGNANVRVAMLAGSLSSAADYAAPLSVDTYWDTWEMFSYSFIASDTIATFAFEDLAMTGSGYDIGIDNVSLEGKASVPEPATILLLGAGLIGFAGFRKKFIRR